MGPFWAARNLDILIFMDLPWARQPLPLVTARKDACRYSAVTSYGAIARGISTGR
jgi:hypothetical protein